MAAMAVVLPENEEVHATPPGASHLLEIENGAPSRHAGRRFTGLTTARLVLDLAAVSVAMLVALRLKGIAPGRDAAGATGRHLLLAVMSLPLWALMLWRARLYSEPHIAGRLDEFRRLVQAEVRTVGVVTVLAFLLKLNVSRVWLIVSAVFAPLLLAIERGLVRRNVTRIRRKGRLRRNVLLVGGNVEAMSLCAMLADDPALGYTPVGFVDDEADRGARLLGGYPVLGTIAETHDVARATGASAVIIATTAVDHERTNWLIRQLGSSGLQVELSSSLCDISPARLQLRPLGRFPVVHVDQVRRDGWEVRAKRTFDIVAAATIGALVAPLLLVVALAIKLTSRGPVHFRQKRVGQHGVPFEVLKFRTMVVNAEAMMEGLLQHNQADGPLFKLKKDPRVTRVGRVLRALSIDEFPQLWNVLRGQMSLVGPRPALPKEVQLWSPDLHGRLAVKPGMTGMWQVSGGARWHSFDEYARLDLYYVDNWSIWTDLAILAKTVPAVIFRRGQA